MNEFVQVSSGKGLNSDDNDGHISDADEDQDSDEEEDEDDDAVNSTKVDNEATSKKKQR